MIRLLFLLLPLSLFAQNQPPIAKTIDSIRIEMIHTDTVPTMLLISDTSMSEFQYSDTDFEVIQYWPAITVRAYKLLQWLKIPSRLPGILEMREEPITAGYLDSRKRRFSPSVIIWQTL